MGRWGGDEVKVTDPIISYFKIKTQTNGIMRTLSGKSTSLSALLRQEKATHYVLFLGLDMCNREEYRQLPSEIREELDKTFRKRGSVYLKFPKALK